MKKLRMSTYTDEQIKFILNQVNMGFSYDEIGREFEIEFGLRKSGDAIRKTYKKYEDFDFTQDEMLTSLRSAHSAKRSRSQTAKENKALLDYLDEKDEFLKEFEDKLKKYPIKIHKPIKFKKSKKQINRVIFAHLSDTHFHSMIEEEEMGGINVYGAVEEARRLAFFFTQVADYKKDHRDVTELVLALNGDLTQGVIHDLESTPAITTQFSAALHLLTQGISFLAQRYQKVRVICTTGNHMRAMHKGNKGRQTKQKWDGYHTMLNVSLKYALKTHTNVTFEIPSTPYASVDILGHHFFITHGDTVLSLGNIGKVIASESIKNKINDLNAGLDRDIDVAVLGHTHVPTYQTLNNGCELVVNGTMSGVDEFAQSIGIFKSTPTQQMFEVTKEYPVGDLRFVRLGEADKMKELDMIISPFMEKF